MATARRPVHSFTFRYDDYGDRAADLAIPQKLTARLGGVHEIVRTPRIQGGAETFRFRFGPDAVLVNSNLLEIGRRFYPFPRLLFRIPLLMAYEKMPKGRRIHDELVRILRELRSLEHTGGWDIRELFCWEQRMSHWEAMGWNVGGEKILNLFNCQLLLETILMVAPAKRSGRCGRFFLDVMDNLCPGAGSMPVNPPTTVSGYAKECIKRIPGVNLLRAIFLNARGMFKREDPEWMKPGDLGGR